MTLFSGVHEVVCKRADEKLYIGFFDDQQKALASVENDSTYVAAWYSLNPLKQLPEGATLNGPLRRSNRSKKDWMSRRERLLIDSDPVREYGNASEAEKAAAYRQAIAVREHLRSVGWPEPMLVDSGNGYHLIYRIDLPNDQASEDLVRGVLLALAAKFDTHESRIDAGNYEANRICKLPSTWARKAPATPERPHRQSSVIEEPDSLQPVPRPLLESLAAGNIPDRPALTIPTNDGLKMEWLRGFLEHYKVPIISERQNGQRYYIDVECPWADEDHHSPSGNTTSTVCYERGWGYSYKCHHSECSAQRGWPEFKQRVIAQNPGLLGYGNSLPELPAECTNADVARYFIKHEAAAKDHINLYDLAERAVFVGTRWSIGDAGDLLLLRDIGECCDHLRWDLPEPEEPKHDYRSKLSSQQFRAATLKQVETLLPPVNYGRGFDQNGYLLGLPEGKVIDIRTGEVRTMERGDFITRRINVSPDPRMPTPVFDKFMRELSNENGRGADEQWIAYMLRLCGYFLLGEYLEHVWSLWTGGGRNGKGSLERLVERILGEFAVQLRWSEIAEQPMGAENTLKRTAFKLMGARVAFAEESGEETGRRKIETSTVKYLTGGDVLVGAAMRQNEVHRKPTHKLVTITNYLPIISPDPAMVGRVQVVPFRACFLGREDPTVEPEMGKELPGILHRWMRGAREFLEGGLQAPPCVRKATKDLFADADTPGRFINDHIGFDRDGYAISESLRDAYTRFVQDIGHPDPAVDMAALYRRLKAFPGVKSATKKINGVVTRVWEGIVLREGNAVTQ